MSESLLRYCQVLCSISEFLGALHWHFMRSWWITGSSILAVQQACAHKMYLEQNVCARRWAPCKGLHIPPSSLPKSFHVAELRYSFLPNHKSAVTKCELRRNFSVSWSYLWLPSALSLVLDIRVKNHECITWFGYSFILDKVTGLILALPEGEFLCTVVHWKF